MVDRWHKLLLHHGFYSCFGTLDLSFFMMLHLVAQGALCHGQPLCDFAHEDLHLPIQSRNPDFAAVVFYNETEFFIDVLADSATMISTPLASVVLLEVAAQASW